MVREVTVMSDVTGSNVSESDARPGEAVLLAVGFINALAVRTAAVYASFEEEHEAVYTMTRDALLVLGVDPVLVARVRDLRVVCDG